MQDYLEYYFSKKTIDIILEGMGAENIKDLVDTKEVYREIMSNLMADEIKEFSRQPDTSLICREQNSFNRNKIIMFPAPRLDDKLFEKNYLKKHIKKKYL